MTHFAHRKDAKRLKRTRKPGPNDYTRNSWFNMVRRCTVPGTVGYQNYGARGIRVCDRWMKFANFLADMGQRPQGSTIDRIDCNGNYEPENCRWLPTAQQQINKRNTRRHLFRGEALCLREISEKYGVSYGRLKDRIRAGWDIDRAVTEPAGAFTSVNGGKIPAGRERWVSILQQTPSNAEAARILGVTWKTVEHFRRRHVRCLSNSPPVPHVRERATGIPQPTTAGGATLSPQQSTGGAA